MVDIAVVGAGAAGLMAAIWAGRTKPDCEIVLLDSARKLGAKILISGGGRCNVTHDHVDESAFAGSTPNAIKKVLRRFDVSRTIEFFREMSVALKREETGKLFPVTDRANTVLNALLQAAAMARVRIVNPWRVESVEKTAEGFRLGGPQGQMRARVVILATGGKSLPKTGSDGHGYEIVRSLGHSITQRVFPALVPLLLPKDHFLCNLSGVSAEATLEVRSRTRRNLRAFTGSTLCTHFGFSGPAVLDISRYYLDAKLDDPETALVVNWWPEKSAEQLNNELQSLQSLGPVTVCKHLQAHLPERLARALCEHAGVSPSLRGHRLTREQRKKMSQAITQMELPILGDRGFSYAEVTAGGVPLSELNLNTMESRICSNLFLCGEICDVDGRIGGYNFQWAWASGYLAGKMKNKK